MYRTLAQTILALFLSFVPCSIALAAQHSSTCAPGQVPAFSLGLASLHARIGSVMGDPLECEHADPATGMTMQQTTTGLALYRSDTNTPMFTNGREHWALTPEGVSHWSGWHGDAGPFGASTQHAPDDTGAPEVPRAAPARVEAVTIVDVFDGADRRFVIARDQSRYLLRIDTACSMDRFPAGSLAFVVSSSEPDGRAGALLVTLDGVECRITDEQVL
jgi:hypothetical protein